jgi:hypothetical protein
LEAVQDLARQTVIVAYSIPSDVSIKWEDEAEILLVTALNHAADLKQAKRLQFVVDKVERGDWLDDSVATLSTAAETVLGRTRQATTVPSHEPDHAHQGGSEPREDQEEEACSDVDETDTSTDDKDSEDYNSHPCPLRTLCRLHDQYQEQPTGIWDRLPVVNSTGVKRGSQREYRRGWEGSVVTAWERLGAGTMRNIVVS